MELLGHHCTNIRHSPCDGDRLARSGALRGREAGDARRSALAMGLRVEFTSVRVSALSGVPHADRAHEAYTTAAPGVISTIEPQSYRINPSPKVVVD